jgi:hypothetical protein
VSLSSTKTTSTGSSALSGSETTTEYFPLALFLKPAKRYLAWAGLKLGHGVGWYWAALACYGARQGKPFPLFSLLDFLFYFISWFEFGILNSN